MKTNLANLMSIVVDEEKKFASLGYSLKEYAYNTSTQELNGTTNVIEDYKEDFAKDFEEYKKTQAKISKIKATIYEKNNTFKLPDGRTIQQAIVDNTNLRKMKSLYNYLLSQKSVKKRETEVNNSYFECKTINFDINEIRKEYETLEKKIQDTDFEISKLNSIEYFSPTAFNIFTASSVTSLPVPSPASNAILYVFISFPFVFFTYLIL